MIYVICCVRDRAADVYGQPFFSPSVAAAIRGFGDAIRAENSGMMNSHPEDFDLYHMGTFEDHHGVFTALAHPVQIAIGKDCIKPLPVRA